MYRYIDDIIKEPQINMDGLIIDYIRPKSL